MISPRPSTATKYAKLGRIKAQYDPDNLFRMNHNITPGPDAGG